MALVREYCVSDMITCQDCTNRVPRDKYVKYSNFTYTTQQPAT